MRAPPPRPTAAWSARRRRSTGSRRAERGGLMEGRQPRQRWPGEVRVRALLHGAASGRGLDREDLLEFHDTKEAGDDFAWSRQGDRSAMELYPIIENHEQPETGRVDRRHSGQVDDDAARLRFADLTHQTPKNRVIREAETLLKVDLAAVDSRGQIEFHRRFPFAAGSCSDTYEEFGGLTLQAADRGPEVIRCPQHFDGTAAGNDRAARYLADAGRDLVHLGHDHGYIASDIGSHSRLFLDRGSHRTRHSGHAIDRAADPRHRRNRAGCTVLNLFDLLGDLDGGAGGLRGEALDLGRHNGKSPAGSAGARRLDGGVERQQVGLAGDIGDELNNRPDLLGGFRQLADLAADARSEEHTSELQSPCNLVCRLLLEKKKTFMNKQWGDNRQGAAGGAADACARCSARGRSAHVCRL